jgi:hypothetical protein
VLSRFRIVGSLKLSQSGSRPIAHRANVSVGSGRPPPGLGVWIPTSKRSLISMQSQQIINDERREGRAKLTRSLDSFHRPRKDRYQTGKRLITTTQGDRAASGSRGRRRTIGCIVDYPLPFVWYSTKLEKGTIRRRYRAHPIFSSRLLRLPGLVERKSFNHNVIPLAWNDQ